MVIRFYLLLIFIIFLIFHNTQDLSLLKSDINYLDFSFFFPINYYVQLSEHDNRIAYLIEQKTNKTIYNGIYLYVIYMLSWYFV